MWGGGGRGGRLHNLFVGGQGGRLHNLFVGGSRGEVTFCGEGGQGCFVGGGGIKGEVSNCTVKQATQQGCLKNQQSKVQSVLPTVMANSSMDSHRGGESVQGVQTDISVVREGSKGVNLPF